MLLSDFDYTLPPERIAQSPLPERDSSRLLVLDRRTGAVAHRVFTDLAEYFEPGDVLIINDTRVTAQRLFGARLGKPGERGRYQTVYADEGGSAAAPTAGLHFTRELLERVSDRGVTVARVTLHVGLGTFRPIETEDIAAHVMHAERIQISPEAAATINGAAGRVIAVGTTSARTLESAAVGPGRVEAVDRETSLYCTPGYQFQVVDALVTNFHMPRSTLLVLVSAFAGRDKIVAAYQEALAREYRFLSFGDAMFIQ